MTRVSEVRTCEPQGEPGMRSPPRQRAGARATCDLPRRAARGALSPPRDKIVRPQYPRQCRRERDGSKPTDGKSAPRVESHHHERPGKERLPFKVLVSERI